MLPVPKRIEPKKAEPAPAPKPAPRREVGIADQIAIRSYVLGKSIGKTSMCYWVGYFFLFNMHLCRWL